jgi:hypothetical protein
VIPDWYILILLSLAAFRIWKLLAEDTVLARPRERFLQLFGPRDERPAVSVWIFMVCPWCLGAWLCGVVYAGWIAFGPGVWSSQEWFMAAVVVAAMSAIVGWLGTLLPD